MLNVNEQGAAWFFARLNVIPCDISAKKNKKKKYKNEIKNETAAEKGSEQKAKELGPGQKNTREIRQFGAFNHLKSIFVSESPYQRLAQE